MDLRTLQAYDSAPETFATEWQEQPPPIDMYDLVKEFFVPGRTADVGCGSGRDTAWLADKDFLPIGYDASNPLLAVARRLHPGIQFEQATLPELDLNNKARFTNVLCETVIMHLPASAIEASVRRLLAILKPTGTLYLSWRVTEGSDHRDDLGRLYSTFDPQVVTDVLSTTSVLHESVVTSASSRRVIHRVIVRKTHPRQLSSISEKSAQFDR